MAAEEQKEIEKERKNKEKRQQYSIELRKQIEDNAERRKREQKMEEGRVKYVNDCYNDWYELFVFFLISRCFSHGVGTENIVLKYCLLRNAQLSRYLCVGTELNAALNLSKKSSLNI